MKKFVLSLAVILFSQHIFASAFDSIADQNLQNEAYAKLLSAADKVVISGDIHSYETLPSILKVVEDYNAELLDLLFRGEDIEKMNSNVSKIDIQCKKNEAKTAAECILFITFKPLGETAVTFSVELNEKQEVISVGNTAYVSRGS